MWVVTALPVITVQPLPSKMVVVVETIDFCSQLQDASFPSSYPPPPVRLSQCVQSKPFQVEANGDRHCMRRVSWSFASGFTRKSLFGSSYATTVSLSSRAVCRLRTIATGSPMSQATASSPGDDIASLPNALKLTWLQEGQVEATLLPVDDAAPSREETTLAAAAKKQKTDSSGTSSDNVSQEEVPETVLQYERQLRKVQASQRSVAELSLDKHLQILYEDSDLIVVDKPPGVLCVPGLYDKPNLLQLVCQKIAKDQNVEEYARAEAKSEMIVHRLDMDTSGVVIFSKTAVALKRLQAAFRDRDIIIKEYHALLCGHLPTKWKGGDIHLPLQRDHRHPPFMRVATPRSEAQAQLAVEDLRTHGFRKLVKKKPKPSHTAFRVLQREYLEFSPSQDKEETTPGLAPEDTIRIPVTRVALVPHTGRTHQLRVHCAAIGYPIVGDPAYGLYGEAQARGGLDESSEPLIGATTTAMQQQLNKYRPCHENSMCLHAAKLGLKHPISGDEMLWTAPTPF